MLACVNNIMVLYSSAKVVGSNQPCALCTCTFDYLVGQETGNCLCHLNSKYILYTCYQITNACTITLNTVLHVSYPPYTK